MSLPLPPEPRIAIVKLSSLGDVVHALPLARALRRAHPRARLAWIAEAPESALLRGHPDLDQVLAVDTRRWRRLLRAPARWGDVLREARAAIRAIRAERFDATIDIQGLMKSGALAGATGAPLRLGFSAHRCRERASAAFANRHVTPPAAAVHVVEQYLALGAPLGVPNAPPEFHLPIAPVAERRMDEFVTEQGIKRRDRLVAINPGAGRPDKRWPIAHLIAVADRLATECAARLLIVWGPNESSIAREIRDGMTARAILAPPTDLHELGSLLRRAALVIASDTGPLHMAAALGAPCLGLFGPTRAERNGPYGARCHALQSPDGAMASLDPSRVFARAQELLERWETRA